MEALYSIFLKTKSIYASKAYTWCNYDQVWKYFMMRSQKQLIVCRSYRNAHHLKQKSRTPSSFRMFPFGFLLTENVFTFCNGYETKPCLSSIDYWEQNEHFYGDSWGALTSEIHMVSTPLSWAMPDISVTLNGPQLTWPETQRADLKNPGSAHWIKTMNYSFF